MESGATLIDIRADSQIARDGTIAGALVIPRNVLEWRLDPASEHRHPAAPQLGDLVIVLCDEGFTRATDVDGGFQAWRAAGLPTAGHANPGIRTPTAAT
jgi:rhodanese-related sulfurtransferase